MAINLKQFIKDPLYRFLTIGFVLYIGWYFIYEGWIHPSGWLDMMVIRNLESSSYLLLELLGYDTLTASHDVNIRTIGIDGTHGLWIGDPCNGITLFALFTGFVIAFPGSLKRKMWFIPLGLILIHLLNIIRIVALSLIIFYFPDPEVLDFNHNYTFTVLVYSGVFALWYWWAVKLSGVSIKQKGDA